jgi:hypothetical protein
MDWIDLAQDGNQWRTLLNIETNLPFPENVEKFLISSGGFSRRTQLHGVSCYSQA